MKTRLTHVRANVRDLNESIKWYTEVLGFEVESVWPKDKPNYAHFVTGDGATFAIGEDVNYPSRGRFNFDIEDIETFWSKIKDKVEIVETLFDTPWGSTKFTIKDPDGNELGFVRG